MEKINRTNGIKDRTVSIGLDVLKFPVCVFVFVCERERVPEAKTDGRNHRNGEGISGMKMYRREKGWDLFIYMWKILISIRIINRQCE